MRSYLAVTIGLLTACASSPTATELEAIDDLLRVEMDQPASLAILDNDLDVVEETVVAIVAAPAHGTAELDATGVLRYAPASGYLGVDEVHYQLTNLDGTSSTATVAIEVGCATCAIGVPVRLAWTPNAPGDMVQGYRLYLGTTEDPATMTMVDEVTIDQPDFDPAVPAVTYDAWDDFRLRLGDTACFRLTAYNAAGESGFSNPACKLVDGVSMRFGL